MPDRQKCSYDSNSQTDVIYQYLFCHLVMTSCCFHNKCSNKICLLSLPSRMTQRHFLIWHPYQLEDDIIAWLCLPPYHAHYKALYLGHQPMLFWGHLLNQLMLTSFLGGQCLPFREAGSPVHMSSWAVLCFANLPVMKSIERNWELVLRPLILLTKNKPVINPGVGDVLTD